MNGRDFLQAGLYLLILTALTPVLGGFMASVFQGRRHLLSLPLGWLERLTYRIGGVNATDEMNWKQYAGAVVVFNLLGFLATLLIQLFQASLPLNPAALPNVPFPLAFNTAVSFMTNTNWQAYSGESTLSYLTQMLALGVQNFLSAATGIAVLIALIHGLGRKGAATLGNFWVDLTRATLYVLLPLSFIFAMILIGQGVVQTFGPDVNATTLEGAEHVIPLGAARGGAPAIPARVRRPPAAQDRTR